MEHPATEHPATPWFRRPLIRLLAVNVAIGAAIAVLMLGGLLLLNPRLRDLILADRAGGVALGLLLFGLVITFGSVAMGSAIMAIGAGDGGGQNGKAAKRIPGPPLARGRAAVSHRPPRRSENSTMVLR